MVNSLTTLHSSSLKKYKNEWLVIRWYGSGLSSGTVFFLKLHYEEGSYRVGTPLLLRGPGRGTFFAHKIAILAPKFPQIFSRIF